VNLPYNVKALNSVRCADVLTDSQTDCNDLNHCQSVAAADNDAGRYHSDI